MRLLTNGPGVVVRDARNEDRNAMNRDPVVEGVKQLMQNVFIKSNYDGAGERSINLDLELAFLMLRCLKIR